MNRLPVGWSDGYLHEPDPIPANVRAVAAKYGLPADALDFHLEGDHGWEPHDKGYADAIEAAARCHLIYGAKCNRWMPPTPTVTVSS